MPNLQCCHTKFLLDKSCLFVYYKIFPAAFSEKRLYYLKIADKHNKNKSF